MEIVTSDTFTLATISEWPGHTRCSLSPLSLLTIAVNTQTSLCSQLPSQPLCRPCQFSQLKCTTNRSYILRALKVFAKVRHLPSGNSYNADGREINTKPIITQSTCYYKSPKEQGVGQRGLSYPSLERWRGCCVQISLAEDRRDMKIGAVDLEKKSRWICLVNRLGMKHGKRTLEGRLRMLLNALQRIERSIFLHVVCCFLENSTLR